MGAFLGWLSVILHCFLSGGYEQDEEEDSIMVLELAMDRAWTLILRRIFFGETHNIQVCMCTNNYIASAICFLQSRYPPWNLEIILFWIILCRRRLTKENK